VHSVFGATDEAYVRILGFISMNRWSVQCASVWTQDLFCGGAGFWVINGQLLVGRHVWTHLSGFQVVRMGGNWIGWGLRLSIGDFSGVGRGYQAQDACYWLVRSTRCHPRMGGTNLWKGVSDDESIQQGCAMVKWVVCVMQRVGWGVSCMCLMRNCIW
jgi:hypothetical protein